MDYLDERTGRRYPLDALRWCGDDGAPLTVEPLPGITAAQIDTTTRSLWRYRAALPGDLTPVSLGEGGTPLVNRPWRGHDTLFKLEWFSPTGSFKDRGSTVMISALARAGVREVLEDSSGNGGSSVSAYAAAAGIAATILAPASTSPAKILQSRAYGAKVDLVPGTRDDTAAEAARRSASTTYASHNWHPFFLQGTKTLAYELWEDFGFTAPDAVVTVAGAGSIVLGLDLGFGELLRAGAIRQRPRLLVAQPANCAPIHAAFHSAFHGAFQGEAAEPRFAPTIAEGTAIRHPVRLPEVVAAIRRCGGATITVTETEIARATRDLAGIGLYAEPTSATAAAAVDTFRRTGVLAPDEDTAVILTGSGLKAAATMDTLI